MDLLLGQGCRTKLACVSLDGLKILGEAGDPGFLFLMQKYV